MNIYDSCPCKSGKKFKFCCYDLFQNLDDTSKLSRVVNLPVYICRIGNNFQEAGLTSIIVARGHCEEMLLIGVYLVDLWCLGVKDTYYSKSINGGTLEVICSSISKCADGIRTIPYEYARTIILGSIKYAASIGFKPHDDWKLSQYFVEPERPFEDNFEFGRNGEPFYFAGPYDEDIF